MVLRFHDFINNVIGGNDDRPIFHPAMQQPVEQPQQSAIPQQTVVVPPYLQQQQQQPVQRPTQYQQPVAPAIMSPSEFQQQMQGPPPPQQQGQQQERDMSGTWVTVQYQYNGKTYNMLMPEANTINMPEGAVVVPNGTITNEPDRVQRAVDAGEGGMRGDTFVGVLDQAPPEIQGLFRSSQDSFDVSQTRPIDRSMPVDSEGKPIPESEVPDNRDWTTTGTPVTNQQGQTPGQVQQDQQSFDQMMQEVNQANESGNPVNYNAMMTPTMTTDMLRQTDPVKAGILEEAGIWSVEADQMVIRDQSGNVRLVPASESVPEGIEIITYGGDSPDTPEKGGLGDALGMIMDVAEVPQRWTQEQFANLYENSPEFVQTVLGSLGKYTPMGAAMATLSGDPWSFFQDGGDAMYGYPAYAQWMNENEAEAERVRREGYNGYEGDRAVWERFQADRNAFERTMDSLFSDPLNAVGSAGAPARGAASIFARASRAVGKADDAIDVANATRRGIGITDEVIDVTNAADASATAARAADEVVEPVVETAARNADNVAEPVARSAADDFANAPTVIDDGTMTVQKGTGYIDSQGQIINRPGQVVVNPVPVERNGVQIVLDTGEDILNFAADVLDIPENVLGAIVDRGILGINQVGEWIGRIPAGEGRQLSDLFRETNPSAVRNAEEEAITQVRDVQGMADRRVQGPNLSDDVVDTVDTSPSVTIPDTPRVPQVDEFGNRIVSPSSERITRPDRETLAVDRETKGLGDAEAMAREGSNPLAVDRDVRTMERDAETLVAPDEWEAIPGNEFMAREQAFSKSRLARNTEEVTSKWPEYLRPQTNAQRISGEGRVGRDFSQRPTDVARSIAPEYPEKWRQFMARYDRSLHTKGGYIEREAARKAEAQWPHLTSKRYGKLEDGRAMRDTYEIMLEADNTVRRESTIFMDTMGEDVSLPEYAWKRWGAGRDQHTALDTIAGNGGSYRPGTRLNEATEIAIFHPDERIASDALDDIEFRLSRKNEGGEVVRTESGHVVTQPGLRPELKELVSRGRTKNMSIRRLREDYLRNLERDKAIGQRFTNRLNAGDTGRLSDLANEPGEQAVRNADPEGAAVFDHAVDESYTAQVRDMEETAARQQATEAVHAFDDPVGAEVADLTEAATAIDDLVAERQPLALPKSIEAPPISLYGPSYGPRTPRPLRGAPPVPEGPATRANRVRTRIENETVAKDIQALVDYRAKAIPEAETVKPGAVRTRREYLDDRTETRVKRMQETANASMSNDDMLSFHVRGRAVSESQAKFFGQKFSNGETLSARWDRYTVEELKKRGGNVMDAEDAAASLLINDYTREVMPESMRKVYDAEYTKAMRREAKDDEGVKLGRKQSRLEAQIDAMQKSRRAATPKMLRGYDRFMTAVRQTFLYNWLTGPRYIATQAVGNGITSIVTKNGDIMFDSMSGNSLRKAWEARNLEGALPDSVMTETMDGYGLSAPRDITRGTASVRDQTLEEVATSKPRPGLLGKWTAPLADRRIRDMAGAFDRLYRESLYAHTMDNSLAVARGTLRSRMISSTPAGMDPQEVGRIIDDLPTRFSSDDLRMAFADADAKWADRNARDWQEAISKTDKVAKAEVKRIFFDGTEVNADVFMKRVLFFHYWMSRSVPLYTEAIARDPVMLYNFSKMIEATSQDDDLSGSKFYQLMQSPFGFNILIRPDSFFATFATLMDDAGYTPEGESILGKALRNSPIMVNPIIQSALNIGGFMGDTFAPDPLGMNKFLQFAGNVTDQMNVHFGWNLTNPSQLQEKTLRKAREFVSGFMEPIPMAEHIPYTDPDGYRENEIRSIIAEIAFEQGLTLDDPIVQDAMTNPESDMYQQAFRRSTMQDTWDIASRILPVSAVLYPKSQLASPKERTMEIAQENQSAEQMGVNATSRGDELRTERNTIAADSEYSRSMQLWQDDYTALGTPEDRAAYRFYNSIRFGSTEGNVIVGGMMYTPQELAAMTPDEKEAVANQWLEETGNSDRVERVRTERKAFREEHPEYGEFVQWQNQMRDYPGGASKWWEDTAAGNPNAARWYNGLTDEQKQNDLHLTSLEGYFAYQGEAYAYWDAEPIDTRSDKDPTPYNPIGSGSDDSGGGASESGSFAQGQGEGRQKGPTKESISTQAQEYQQAQADYNNAASQMLGQPVSVDQMNPMLRSAVESNLESMGVSPPYMGRDLYDYLQWAEAQGGGDTSVASYLAWYQKQNPDKEKETPETPET